MVKSEAQFLQKFTLSCPGCRGELPGEEQLLGSVLQCPHCSAHVYRALWHCSSRSTQNRCKTCRREMLGDQCETCGKVPRAWKQWLQRVWSKVVLPRGDRDITLLNVDRLRLEAGQQRNGIDLRELDGLCQSISEMGLIQPLLVRPIDGDSYQVISGHRRLLALRRLSWGRVPVRILKVSALQAARIRLSENRHREPLQLHELAELLERTFLGSDNQSLQQVSQHLGLSASEVSTLLSVLKTPPRLRDSNEVSEARSLEPLAEDVGETVDCECEDPTSRGDQTERLDPLTLMSETMPEDPASTTIPEQQAEDA